MPFPANTRGNCILQPDQTQIIDPGTYGTLTINARSHVKLRTGTYYFRGLSLEADSLLDVDNAAGPVYVYVRDTLAFNGKVVPTSPTKPNVLFGYAGTAQFNVLRSFWGILSAPNATVSLAPAGTTGHTGSFFAKTLTAQAGSTIHHRPFGPATFCAGSTTCSVLCPCGPGGSCQSNSDCQAGLSCTAGICQATSIDDGNPCTADSVDGSGNVIHTPLPAGTSCADADLCNGQEVCNATAQCLPGSPPNLDDGNACTTDTCTPSGGVIHTPVAAGTSCSNGNACDGTESCTADGTCAGSPPPDLDDQNPCTADTCTEPGGVIHTPLPAGTSCADADVCDGAEVCNATGTCVSGTPPLLDDSDPCTTDSCDPNTGIHHEPVPDGTSCADADLCNGSEICDGSGTCVAGAPSEVDDSNPCTVDACDPVTGVSHEPVAEGTSCDDGDLCNGTNTCDANANCIVGIPRSRRREPLHRGHLQSRDGSHACAFASRYELYGWQRLQRRRELQRRGRLHARYCALARRPEPMHSRHLRSRNRRGPRSDAGRHELYGRQRLQRRRELRFGRGVHGRNPASDGRRKPMHRGRL